MYSLRMNYYKDKMIIHFIRVSGDYVKCNWEKKKVKRPATAQRRIMQSKLLPLEILCGNTV